MFRLFEGSGILELTIGLQDQLLKAALEIVSKPYADYRPYNPYTISMFHDPQARAPGDLLTYGRAYWLLTAATPEERTIFLKHGWQGGADSAYWVNEGERKRTIPTGKEMRTTFLQSILHRKYDFGIVEKK